MNEGLKWRVLNATRGSQLGAILACAADELRDELPRFTSKAICTSDGYLSANFVDQYGVTHHNAFIDSYGEVERNVTRLSQHLELTPAENLEVHGLISDWIAIDYR